MLKLPDRKKSKKRNQWLLAVFLTAGLLAGCGTGPAVSSTDAQKTEDTKSEKDGGSKESTPEEQTGSGQENNAGETGESGQEDTDASQESGTEEKTEVRREKYDDCDGSGHGYVEIYYSDGSMETEEY